VSVITQTIDKVLAQLSSPTLTLAQKQVVGLPTVQQLNAAIAAALAAVPIADKTQYQALQTSLATVQKQYGLKLQQIGAMMQALKISECGNSLTTAQQLGCRVYPAQLPILGKCLPGYTKATIAGSAVGACVQGTPTGRPIYATIPSAFYR
jgi:hypothetical protein